MLSTIPHLRRCFTVLPNCFRSQHHPPAVGHPVLVRNIHKAVLSGEVVSEGCTRLPDLSLMWPFHLWPSDIAASLLGQLQQASHLPWWGTVLVGAALLKLPIFGFNIYNLRKVQQFFVTSPRQMSHFVLTYFNNLVTKGEVHALKMANDERRFTLLKGSSFDHHFKPQMFGHISYVPVYWLAGSHLAALTGLHWLNRIQYVPLLTGGLPWCGDLTLTDPFMILPLLCVTTGLLNLYLHPIHWLFPVPRLTLTHLWTMAPLIAVAASLVSSLPVDILLYLISCNLTACLLNTLVLRHPTVYDEFGLVSSGEFLNRIIPPAVVFKELNKTFERQVFLLEQKEEQAALVEQKKTGITLQSVEETKRIEDGLSADIVVKDDITPSFVRKTKHHGDLLPHLNVKKVFMQE